MTVTVKTTLVLSFDEGAQAIVIRGGIKQAEKAQVVAQLKSKNLGLSFVKFYILPNSLEPKMFQTLLEATKEVVETLGLNTEVKANYPYMVKLMEAGYGDMIELQLAEALKSIRKDQNLTQQVLGDFCGLSRQTIAEIEVGRRLPGVSTLKAIAENTGHKLVIKFEKKSR